MLPKQTWYWFAGLLVVLLAVMVWIAWRPPTPPNIGFENPAAVLAIAAAGAVAIERIIEIIWTIVGLTKSSFWPLNVVGKQIDQFVSTLDRTLEPFYREANESIDRVATAQKWTQEQIEAAKTEVEEIQKRTNDLKDLAPGNQRVQLIATSASQGVKYLEKKYPHLNRVAAITEEAVTGVDDFLATFKENPGKQLISLFIGATLGIIVAGFIGLDVIQAATQPTPEATMQTLEQSSPNGSVAPKDLGLAGAFPGLGIALTGLLMGLGSNPTHDVIRTLQEVKKSRKADNIVGASDR